MNKIEEIDLVLGNNEKNNIVEITENFQNEKQKDVGATIGRPTRNDLITQNKINVSDISKQKEFLDFGDTIFTEKSRAVVKVQDGCDNFCSYCIIPYAKGRVRSRKIENIISEITKIVHKGIKEVVITGIHIASYGKDFKDGTTLIDLLEEINKIEDLKRIRLRFFRTKDNHKGFCKKTKTIR